MRASIRSSVLATWILPAFLLSAAIRAQDPTHLTCGQVGTGKALIAWTNPASYDGIRIFRDGTVLIDLPGTATSYLDTNVALGPHIYAVRSCHGTCPETPEMLGTHVVKVYLDGGTTPAASLDVTAGNGSEVDNVGYLALGQGNTGQSGAFDLDFVRVAFGQSAPADSSYTEPEGGWAYAYEADAGQDVPGATPGTALDGTWNHDNGSDAWDLSPVGGVLSATNRPGGASVVSDGDVSCLRIQDPGDPRDYAMPDPSNRKVYLYHDLAGEAASSTFLDDGVTLYFRARIPTSAPIDQLYPDGGSGIVNYPAAGDGYRILDGGKGMVGLKQGAGGIVSFSFANSPDANALVFNNLNGKAVSGDVDTGEAGVANAIPLDDPTAWHDVWVTISKGGPSCSIVMREYAPPSNLACAQDGAVINLSWTNNGVYSGIRIFRDGKPIGDVGGTETAYTDAAAPVGNHSYTVSPCLAGICPDTLELGTHVVKVYLDGGTAPAAALDVTAGAGSEADAGYLGIGQGSTGQSGAFDLDFVRVAFEKSAPADASYPAPAGGWAYAYEADAGQDAPGTAGLNALDGTWVHENGSDTWDGSPVGGVLSATNRPGGASVVSDGDVSCLRIQDPGDPTDYTMPDPSNRKVYLYHDLAAQAAGDAFLDDGVTLHFRARIPTSAPIDQLYPDGGGGIVDYPGAGDGYRLHDGGKGMVGLKQKAGGIISFSLANAPDANALIFNNLNGKAVSGDVDTGDAGVANAIALDPTAWHDVWVTISKGTGLLGPSCSVHVCPIDGDTRCTGLDLAVLTGTTTVRATATATDDSGDAIRYTFTATGGPGGPLTVGPQAQNVADLALIAGDWTVTVEVDDDPACGDPPGTCSGTVSICPIVGDTRCSGVDLAVVEGTATVTATATATDDSGDAIIYTFTATGPGGPVVVGPQAGNVADLVLSEGEWTVTVEVDDDPACGDPPGTCSGTVAVVLGGRQVPGDCNQDRVLDISDAVCMLGVLFLGNPVKFPCGEGSPTDPGSKALMDWQPDNLVDISDGIGLLSFLFLGKNPHHLAVPGAETTGCVAIPGCPSNSKCP